MKRLSGLNPIGSIGSREQYVDGSIFKNDRKDDPSCEKESDELIECPKEKVKE